jgi:hypothetical protein
VKHDLDNLPEIKVGDLVVPAGYFRFRPDGQPVLGVVIEVENDEFVKVVWNDEGGAAWSHARILDILSSVDD